MDSVTATPATRPAPVTAEPTATTTPSDLHLAALLQPALIYAEGWLPVTCRLWLEWAMLAAQDALEHVLDRPVAIYPAGADPGSPREAVFAVAFDHPAAPGGGNLSFDLPAARAIVEAIESDFANVRGAGAVSETELGLLEYAALATIDRVLHAAPASAQGLVVRSFHDARSTRTRLDERPLPAIALRIRVAGREGIARLHVPGWAPAVANPPDPAGTIIDHADAIEVRLALPPIRLPRADARSLQPGDVLLLGATDLQSFGANCHLASARGWLLSSATILRDSPPTISIRCGAFTLDTLPVAAPADDQVILNPLVGSQQLALDQIQQWRPERVVDLPKDLTTPVDLFDGLHCLARGELVRIDGEIGIRLTQVTPAEPPRS